MGGVLGAGTLLGSGMPPAPPPPASTAAAGATVAQLPPMAEFHPQPQPQPQQHQLTPSNVQSMQDELNQQINNQDIIEDCQGESCCPIESEEAMQPPHCNCEAVEVPCTATSSERSSSYNSCTLPLKPLKGILKKSSNPNHSGGGLGLGGLGSNMGHPQMSLSSLTLPRDMLCHGQQLLHQHPNQFEVVPFDQVPPCDDCMQRARHRGSYGDVCQNLEMDSSCGFQMTNLPASGPTSQSRPGSAFRSPTHSSLSQNSNQMAMGGGSGHGPPAEFSGFCCKHDRPRQNSLINVIPPSLPTGSNLLVISRQNSFDEKEEVEAVESSV